MSLKMMEQKLLDWIDFLVPINYPVKISLQNKKEAGTKVLASKLFLDCRARRSG